MFNTIWLLVIKNWKTTATGVASALIWLLKAVGVEIPDEVALSFTGFLVSLGLIFAKDGDKSGL
jgi:hypothetical protein